jgi:hypothetical protein
LVDRASANYAPLERAHNIERLLTPWCDSAMVGFLW